MPAFFVLVALESIVFYTANRMENYSLPRLKLDPPCTSERPMPASI